MPEEIAEMTRKAVDGVGIPVGIHCHNDCELAVANSLAAVEAKLFVTASPEVRARRRYEELREGGTEIDIADNGSGIGPESRALIFEKFARLNDPTRAGGAGLGLAICKEIMEFLGGDIAYLPGRGGACFRITLPRRPPVLPENRSDAPR